MELWAAKLHLSLCSYCNLLRVGFQRQIQYFIGTLLGGDLSQARSVKSLTARIQSSLQALEPGSRARFRPWSQDPEPASSPGARIQSPLQALEPGSRARFRPWSQDPEPASGPGARIQSPLQALDD